MIECELWLCNPKIIGIISKHVLVDLVVHWLGNWVVMGSNLVKNEIDFLFAKISFWHECERVEKP